MISFTQIKETCIYVKDLEQTRFFYQDKLGLDVINYVKGRHVFFSVGSSVLLCFNAEKTLLDNTLPPHGASGSIHFAFEVKAKDYEEAKARILECSIYIEHEQEWTNNRKSFYFRDPDNHLLEIIQQGVWAIR